MKNKFIKNLSWIFFGNVAHAILQFLLHILCARKFGADDFGLINYGAAIIAFFTAVGTLGFGNVATKFFAEDESQTGAILGTGIISRVVFAVFSVIAIQMIAGFGTPTDMKIRIILLCQSMQILFASMDIYVYWFRYKNRAKDMAILRLAAFFVSAVWKLVAILVFHNIVYYVIGITLETALFSTFQILAFKKNFAQISLEFNFATLKTLLKTAYPFIFSALLVTIYGQTDKIMLKSMLSNSAVGLYSASLTLAGAIAIIPTALIEGFRPEIMSYKVTDQVKYIQRLKQLYGIVFWVSIAYGAFISIFAKQIVVLTYGKQYLDSVPALSLVVWYTSFSYFGAINNVYMVAENKTVWVQIITIIGAALNVLLNLVLIPQFGIVGAAAASLITQFVANFFLIYLIKPLRESFFIMINGIALKWIKK